MERPRTSFNITREDMGSLRELAAQLGFYTTRGAGAGHLGNITALLQGVATAYRWDAAGTFATLAALLKEEAATEGKRPPRVT